jgi:molecular chaperone GrpE
MADYYERNGDSFPDEAHGSATRDDRTSSVGGEMPFRPAAAPPAEENGARTDRLLRALAEADNARKRAERMAVEARQYAIGDFARELLAVADNLERALAMAEREGSAANNALTEGVKQTYRLLRSTIERFGVKKIESFNMIFDPKLHEAVMVVEDDRKEPGIIVDVAEEGYMLHDRLLRPARVFVNNPNVKPAMTAHGDEPG